MIRARAVADLLLACLAGAGLGALVLAYAWPDHSGAHFLDVKFVLAGAGLVPLGVLGGGVAVMFAAVIGRWRGLSAPAVEGKMRSAAFRTALLIAIGASAGAWVFHLRELHTGLRDGVIAGGVLGLLLPLPALPRALTRTLGGATALVLALLLAGVGYSVRLDHDGVQIPGDLDPLPAIAEGARRGSGPDVLLISVDTLRADEFLSEAVPTPALDRLRARSRWATYGRAPAPSTLPSHVSMVTGRHPLETGCYTNSSQLTSDAGDTLPELFHAAGWRTAGVAANDLLEDRTGFTRGFEAFTNVAWRDPNVLEMTKLVMSTRRMSPVSLFLSDSATVAASVGLATTRTNVPPKIDALYMPPAAGVVRDAALAYFEQLYADAQPYFFFLHFMDPHLPYTPAVGFAGRLTAGSALPARYAHFPQLSTMCSDTIQTDLRSDDPAARADALAAAAYLRLAYGEELMAVDAAVGEVLARAERSGRPLVVLFTADHGEHFAEHNTMGHGNSLYEELLRVPFLIAGPGVEPGRFDAPPRLEDIGITLLHAAGIAVRSFGQGRDLLQPNSEPGSPAFATHEDAFAVLDGEWKARFSWDCRDPRASPLLLITAGKADAEDENLAETQPAVREALQALAEKARVGARARIIRAMDAVERANLAALGYAFDAEGNVIAN